MSEERFDDELLRAYADQFFGYGSYSGPYWFVGMEEGGGDDFFELRSRLLVWDQHGRNELEDIYRFHQEVGIKQWFNPGAKIQSTWGKCIRVLLGAENISASTEQVRNYQADRLGRTGGETCLLELLPLPSPSVGHWHYARRSSLPQLRDRTAYMTHYAPGRVNHLHDKVMEFSPKAVVFTSMDAEYRSWWERVARVTFTRQMIAGKSCYFGQNANTVFVITQHPVAMGVTNDYFREVGSQICLMCSNPTD